MTIVTLSPFTQGIGTAADLASETAGPIDTPVPVNGGSVSDGDDSSYMEIGAWYDTTVNASHLEIVICDFQIDPALTPTAMAPQFRVSTPAATYANPPEGGRYWWNIYTAVGGDGSALDGESYDYGEFQQIGLCNVPEPTTLATFWGDPLDMNSPNDPGNWCEIAPGGGEMPGAYEALTGAGLRLAVLIDNYTTGTVPPASRIPWVNLHEVRLLVATPSPPGGYAPTCRKFPLDTQRAFPRSKAQQYGTRRGAGSYS